MRVSVAEAVVSGFEMVMVMSMVSESAGRDMAYEVFLEFSVVIALSVLFIDL